MGALVKLSKDCESLESSSLVVCERNNKLWIYGMIDHAIHLQSYLTLEDNSQPEVPGIFQSSISGIGIVSVMTKLLTIARLKQGELLKDFKNVFNKGPVSSIIQEAAENTEREILKGHSKINKTEVIHEKKNISKI